MSALPANPPATDQATRLRAIAAGNPLTLRATRRSKVIAIASGKGGVGKTSLAVNLAIALQARGVRTTLVDLDVGLANADLLCGLNPATRLDHLAIDGTTLDQLGLLAPGGFTLIPGIVGGSHPLTRGVSGPDIIERLPELDAGSDVVILDCGAGMGPPVRAGLRSADLPILIATPEPTSIADAYALLKIACNGSSPHFAPVLALNQCASAHEATEVHARIQSVTLRFLDRPLPLLAVLPADPALPASVRARRPLLLHAPTSPASSALQGVATAVIHRLSLQADLPRLAPSSGVWQRLARLVGASL